MKKNTLILASGALLFAPGVAMEASEKSPNILIFIADDLGWEEVGAYGHKVVKTPNMDWLASQGMRFDNFYLTASSSSPSRSSIFTGMYPSCTGARNLHENMPAYINMFPDRLHDKGYYTMLVGKTHGTNLPTVQKRFDYGSFIDWSKPWTMVDLWKNALKQRPKDKPFFMFAASIDPHRPFKQGVYEKPYSPDEVVVPPYLHDSPEMREELADYYDEISRLDNHIGQVLQLLREEGELENTCIIVMSDNGRAFQQSKTRVNMQGLKSPFIVYYPPLIEKGVVTESLASAVDIAPTLLDLAGAKRAAGVQGISLLPILKDAKAEVREFAFAEHNWHVFKAYERAVITKQHIYIRNWLPELTNPVVVEVMKEPSYKAMLAAYEKGELSNEQLDCFISPRPAEELFDIKEDVHCLKNIATKKSMKGVKETLGLVLKSWQMSIGDTFDDSKLKEDTSDRITGKPFKQK